MASGTKKPKRARKTQVRPKRQIALSIPERVAFIAEMMRACTWVRGRSEDDLARLWGMTASGVRNHSAEAARVVRAEIANPDAAVVDVVANAMDIMRECRDAGDARNAIGALKLVAEVTGAMAPQKHQVESSGSLTVASPAEAAALVRREFGTKAATPAPPAAPSDAAQ